MAVFYQVRGCIRILGLDINFDKTNKLQAIDKSLFYLCNYLLLSINDKEYKYPKPKRKYFN